MLPRVGKLLCKYILIIFTNIHFLSCVAIKPGTGCLDTKQTKNKQTFYPTLCLLFLTNKVSLWNLSGILHPAAQVCVALKFDQKLDNIPSKTHKNYDEV